MGEKDVDKDQTNQLFELMYEIRERTTRIETETKRLGIIETKAENADDKAKSAYQKAETNEKSINKIETNIKWTWGFVVSIILGIAGVTAKLFI